MSRLFFWLAVFIGLNNAAKEIIKNKSIKVGSTKFKCTFNLVSDGSNFSTDDSKVTCTPNKPKNKKVKNMKITTTLATYTLSFKINPEQITSASMGERNTMC